MELPKFKKRVECDAFCEAHNQAHDIMWVRNTLKVYAQAGSFRGYEWVRKWAIERGIDYAAPDVEASDALQQQHYANIPADRRA